MQRLDGMDASFVYLDTPATPMQKMNAERIRYQTTSISSSAFRASEDDSADSGHEEEEGDDLERDQELGQEELADPGGRPEACLERRPAAVDRLQARADDRDAELG